MKHQSLGDPFAAWFINKSSQTGKGQNQQIQQWRQGLIVVQNQAEDQGRQQTIKVRDQSRGNVGRQQTGRNPETGKGKNTNRQSQE